MGYSRKKSKQAGEGGGGLRIYIDNGIFRFISPRGNSTTFLTDSYNFQQLIS